MSRLAIHHDNYDIIVGWDPGLDTYFGIVEDVEEDEDYPLIWIGTYPNEYIELTPFICFLKKSLLGEGIVDVKITPETLRELKEDREKYVTRFETSSFMKLIKNVFAKK